MKKAIWTAKVSLIEDDRAGYAILELRERIEALEAKHREADKPIATPIGSALERVQDVLDSRGRALVDADTIAAGLAWAEEFAREMERQSDTFGPRESDYAAIKQHLREAAADVRAIAERLCK